MDPSITRRARAFLIALVLGGCTYEWNGDTPAFPVTGTAPSLSSFTKLNGVAAGRASLMTGPDGAAWTVFCSFWSTGPVGALRNCKSLRLVRLDDPPAQEDVAGDGFAQHLTELYAWKDDAKAKTRTLTLHRPGDAPADDAVFVLPLPSGRAAIYTNDGGNPDVFVYLAEDSSVTHYDVYRRDRRFQLTLPLPAGVDAGKVGMGDGMGGGGGGGGGGGAVLNGLLFTADGNTLLVSDPSSTLTAWSTLDGSSVALGIWPTPFAVDEDRHAALTFDSSGVTSVPLDGSPAHRLTAARVDTGTLTEDVLYYHDRAAGGMWSVPLDGSTPPVLIEKDAARLRTFGPNGELTYSNDPASRYSGGAGDGWLDAWKFCNRCRLIQWSSDGARLRYLENAATLGTYGDLTSVAVPNGAPTLLGINVHAFTELPDHRVLAVENAVYAGSWNRLVVVDEVAHTKHWVVPSAADFLLAPSGRELIVDVVSGASGFDILRVPAP